MDLTVLLLLVNILNLDVVMISLPSKTLMMIFVVKSLNMDVVLIQILQKCLPKISVVMSLYSDVVTTMELPSKLMKKVPTVQKKPVLIVHSDVVMIKKLTENMKTISVVKLLCLDVAQIISILKNSQ